MNKTTRLKKIIEKKESERKLFLSKLSFQMTCLKYVTDRVQTHYSYFDVIKELSKIELDYRLEYIKVKLYEMMLIMSETDKGKIFYNESEISEKLFSFYQANNRYFKEHLQELKDSASRIRYGQYHNSVRQSA
jgi:hypothetical protein